MKKVLGCVAIISLALATSAHTEDQTLVYQAGHSSLQSWLLPELPPQPENNRLTKERVELGKHLFFDPRLSGKGNMSCATCHNPSLGWSDGLATAVGHNGQVLGRASPTVINTAYNPIQMWDGRKATLEEQALGPMEAEVEMASDVEQLLKFLSANRGYQELFEQAYPGEGITRSTLARGIASYERTVISNNPPFDRWVRGDTKALTAEQIAGFKLFVDPDKGNCAACHGGANFTDNGFHNLGLASFAADDPDLGRYKQKPLRLMKGAFKTPTLRDVSLTAPYFHDGSAKDLMEVVDHYVKGGEVKTNLSPNMKQLTLNAGEKQALVAFMLALTSPQKAVDLPVLPQ